MHGIVFRRRQVQWKNYGRIASHAHKRTRTKRRDTISAGGEGVRRIVGETLGAVIVAFDAKYFLWKSCGIFAASGMHALPDILVFLVHFVDKYARMRVQSTVEAAARAPDIGNVVFANSTQN